MTRNYSVEISRFTHQEFKYHLPKGQGEPHNCQLYCIFPNWVVETSHKGQPNL